MANDGLSGPALTQDDLNEITAISRTWAKERKNVLIANISRLGLVRTRELLNSVKSGVRSRQGEANTIYFKYKYYGLFLDKGAENVGRNHVTISARHWFSQYVYGQQLDELLESLAGYYSELALKTIVLTDVNA